METHPPRWQSPRDYAPDLHEQLCQAENRGSFRERFDNFIFEVKLHPALAVTCAVGGVLVGALGVIVPALIVAWVIS